MTNQPFPVEESDPWIIPLHGIETPVTTAPRTPPTAATDDDDELVTAHFYLGDELPTLEFRPRLRRSA